MIPSPPFFMEGAREVKVLHGDVEKAISILRRKIAREGTLKEIKRRRHFEKPSERKKRKAKEARRRLRKKLAKMGEL